MKKKLFLILVSLVLLVTLFPGGVVFAKKPIPPGNGLITFESGFESGNFDDFDDIIGTPSISAAANYTGQYGMVSDNYGFVSKNLKRIMTPRYVQFRVKVVEYPDERTPIARLNTRYIPKSWHYKWWSTTIELMPDGRLFTKNNATQTELQLNQWYLVSFNLWDCWIDGVKEIDTRTWNTGKPNVYEARFGLLYSKGGTIHIDEVYVSNNSTGPM